MLVNDGMAEGCAEGVSAGGRYPYTPNQWLHAYGLDPFHALGFDGRGERLALIEMDGFLQSDLDGFTDCFGLPRQTPSIITVPGGPPLSGPGDETILDLQVLAATAPGLDEIQVFESTDGQGGPATDITSLAKTLLAAIAQPRDQRPNVVSISIAGCEAEGTLADNLLSERTLLRAAATGISVFVATGDTGITSCRYEQDLGGLRLTNAVGVVSAGYPATSPWVTAVGGTNLWLNPDNSIAMEIVWNSWEKLAELPLFGQTVDVISMAAGTSGLSAWFRQPWWQRRTAITNDAFGPFRQARAVPDVALLADDVPGYAYLNDGEWGNTGGTSAAAPLMAGAVAVMNQTLRVSGQRRLGFLNPLLYQFGNDEHIRSQVYHDVTYGDNETTWQVFPWGANSQSFSAEAKPGYDLATGWGSPRFPAFFEQVRLIDP
ncbi:MAG: S53 family peptidase [Chromatiaceae bacterium]|nr:S53 family peptidase [Chromatiaceae bacterium]MCF8014421.1 S53 family peptidase [Chromatiaceae bacterium]